MLQCTSLGSPDAFRLVFRGKKFGCQYRFLHFKLTKLASHKHVRLVLAASPAQSKMRFGKEFAIQNDDEIMSLTFSSPMQ